MLCVLCDGMIETEYSGSKKRRECKNAEKD